MNAGARLVYSLCFSDHISDALVSLHFSVARESDIQGCCVAVIGNIFETNTCILLFKEYMYQHQHT